MGKSNRRHRPQGPVGNARMIKELGAAIIMFKQGGMGQASRLFVILFDSILVSLDVVFRLPFRLINKHTSRFQYRLKIEE
jgi:hypothetical protein